MIHFENIWRRIREHEGDIFYTITGLKFTYSIEGDIFHPSRTDYNISKADFEKAYAMMPIKGPGGINNIVRGPAYVWAVLHDSRISGKE